MDSLKHDVSQRPGLTVSEFFPPDVRNALAYAARLPDHIRLVTIERVISEARARYPERFKPEP